MENRSRWYENIAREIRTYQDTLTKKETKKLKLDLLLRVAGRVDEFSAYCGECQTLKQEIATLVADLSSLIHLPGREARKRHTRAISGMVKHLQKVHKLVAEGHYMGIGIGIGIAIGAGLGAVLNNPAIGPGIGIAIGVAIGSYLDKKAKREGKVI
jgi:hypothetical protein